MFFFALLQKGSAVRNYIDKASLYMFIFKITAMKRPYIRPEIEIFQIEPEGVILGSSGESPYSIPFDDDDQGAVDRKPKGRDWENYEAF